MLQWQRISTSTVSQWSVILVFFMLQHNVKYNGDAHKMFID